MPSSLAESPPPLVKLRPTSALSAGCTVRGWWNSYGGGLYQDSGATTPVAIDTDPVGYLPERLAGTNPFLQTLSGSRPLYRTSIQNGLPMLQFDGVAAHLIADGLATYLTGTDQPCTFFAVIRPGSTSGTGQDILSGGRSSSTTPAFTFERNLLGLRSIRRDDTNTQIIVLGTSQTLSTSAARVVSFTHTGTQLTTRIGGTAAETFSQDVGAMTLNQATLGALRRTTLSGFFFGYLGEVIFVQGAMLAAERLAMEQYLKGVWGTV